MKLVECIVCGDKTTNILTEKCDICKVKETIKKQEGRTYESNIVLGGTGI